MEAENKFQENSDHQNYCTKEPYNKYLDKIISDLKNLTLCLKSKVNEENKKDNYYKNEEFYYCRDEYNANYCKNEDYCTLKTGNRENTYRLINKDEQFENRCLEIQESREQTIGLNNPSGCTLSKKRLRYYYYRENSREEEEEMVYCQENTDFENNNEKVKEEKEEEEYWSSSSTSESSETIKEHQEEWLEGDGEVYRHSKVRRDSLWSKDSLSRRERLDERKEMCRVRLEEKREMRSCISERVRRTSGRNKDCRYAKNLENCSMDCPCLSGIVRIEDEDKEEDEVIVKGKMKMEILCGDNFEMRVIVRRGKVRKEPCDMRVRLRLCDTTGGSKYKFGFRRVVDFVVEETIYWYCDEYR